MSGSAFPPITQSDILHFQFSSWYPIFSQISIKSTIIRPLSSEFAQYLNADGVFIPEGADNAPVTSELSDEEEGDDQDEEEGEPPQPSYAFPELDARIRECIEEYGAVFPKLNFSSPKDASWILPGSSPLKCTSPSDVYMLLKSSDFVTHDLSKEIVFSGCSSTIGAPDGYALELVLRKWYPVDRSRELRCFIRDSILIGISQRDTNYYEFYNDPMTRDKVVSTVTSFWDTNVKNQWDGPKHYTLDLLLTRDISRAHILDFNPYLPRTDPLLFTYDELNSIHLSSEPIMALPLMKVIDSRSHPAANSNSPANQHNMIPFEALSLSSGRDIEEFAKVWEEEVRHGMKE